MSLKWKWLNDTPAGGVRRTKTDFIWRVQIQRGYNQSRAPRFQFKWCDYRGEFCGSINRGSLCVGWGRIWLLIRATPFLILIQFDVFISWWVEWILDWLRMETKVTQNQYKANKMLDADYFDGDSGILRERMHNGRETSSAMHVCLNANAVKCEFFGIFW